jgi:uncharacterized protein YdeI (YjbR/CyaY-like superfamily)
MVSETHDVESQAGMLMTGDSLSCQDRGQWREWLKRNHDHSPEIWLVFFKKHTERPSIRYEEAVEEALCFGWIDSIVMRIDDDRYAQKFTPRRLSSKWSRLNIARARRMMESGRMTEAGMAKFQPVLDGEIKPEGPPPKLTMPSMPPAFQKALERDPDALETFEGLTPSHRKRYLFWIAMAKREETRDRRIQEAIRLLRKGEKLGLK